MITSDQKLSIKSVNKRDRVVNEVGNTSDFIFSGGNSKLFMQDLAPDTSRSFLA